MFVNLGAVSRMDGNPGAESEGRLEIVIELNQQTRNRPLISSQSTNVNVNVGYVYA